MMRLHVLGIALFTLGVVALRADASAINDLRSAAQDQKVAFILVTEPGAQGVDQARQKIRDAMRQVDRSTMIEVDRFIPANAEIVAKFRLSGVPVPLILVAARNGALAGDPQGPAGWQVRLHHRRSLGDEPVVLDRQHLCLGLQSDGRQVPDDSDRHR
jgi:hypothetical protein